MNRRIPKFFCLTCKSWQIKNPTNLYKAKGSYITYLFCNSCLKWIEVQATNMTTGNQFFTEFREYPSIINNDSPEPDVIFQGNNVDALEHVCRKYNLFPDYTYGQACQDYRKYINNF